MTELSNDQIVEGIKKKVTRILNYIGDYSSVIDVEIENFSIMVSITFSCGCHHNAPWMDMVNFQDGTILGDSILCVLADHNRFCYKNKHRRSEEFMHTPWFVPHSITVIGDKTHNQAIGFAYRLKIPYDCLGLVSLFDPESIPNWVKLYLSSRGTVMEIINVNQLNQKKDHFGGLSKLISRDGGYKR